ncbi:MAG TPA: hypothetical protein VH417_14300 [Vicinamibacterales bacterium]|jgi:hypothetical protein
MRRLFTTTNTMIALALVAAGVAAPALSGQQANLPLEPQKERGTSVTPAYEGWYPNPDGSFTLLLGYYNRNARQTLDIPVGPNNRIEPGDADQGQPTHFEIGRQWGVFTIKVPKDFGTKALTWTIVSNGEKQSLPLALNKAYTIAPFKEIGMGNTPPVLSFSQGGAKLTGPPVGTGTTLSGRVNQPVAITVWVEDHKSPDQEGGRGRGPSSVAQLSFHKFRGPGRVAFDPGRTSAPVQGAKVTTNATFDAPGDYILRVQANDESGEGGGGFQCCWTNAHVKVSVQP